MMCLKRIITVIALLLTANMLMAEDNSSTQTTQASKQGLTSKRTQAEIEQLVRDAHVFRRHSKLAGKHPLEDVRINPNNGKVEFFQNNKKSSHLLNDSKSNELLNKTILLGKVFKDNKHPDRYVFSHKYAEPVGQDKNNKGQDRLNHFYRVVVDKNGNVITRFSANSQYQGTEVEKRKAEKLRKHAYKTQNTSKKKRKKT